MSIGDCVRTAGLTASVAFVLFGSLSLSVGDVQASDGAVPMLERGLLLEVFINESAYHSYEQPSGQGARAHHRDDEGQERDGHENNAETLQGVAESQA
ncbi:MAG: hypothetical protein ACFB01_10640, partial [Cohaesibacteraceae bacterium]